MPKESTTPPASPPVTQRQPAPVVLGSAAMQRILSRFSNLPAQSALLGLGDDGLPVMLDLLDPSPGAVAIIGDEREAQLEMLRSVIASAALRNSPRALQFVVLSMQPESWQKWVTERGFDRHSMGILPANEETAREWILRMADWTEDRRTGRRSGPPVLFILDTLSFLPRLELDARLNFDWLAKEGPIAAIWPIAAISIDLAASLGSRLGPFQTKVLGYTDDPSLYVRVANVDPEETGAFRKRGTFAVRVGENWLRFRLPG